MEMNKVATSVFNLQSTVFTNPHGLGDIRNKSTVSDICTIASIMAKEVYLDIASTPKHKATYYDFPRSQFGIAEEGICEKEVNWVNTYKVLSSSLKN